MIQFLLVTMSTLISTIKVNLYFIPNYKTYIKSYYIKLGFSKLLINMMMTHDN